MQEASVMKLMSHLEIQFSIPLQLYLQHFQIVVLMLQLDWDSHLELLYLEY